MPKIYSGSGHICSVINCSNSQRNRQIWRNSDCKLHVGLAHNDCPCLVPFSLYSFPKDEGNRLQWIRALNRKDFTPSKNSKVCSVHFPGNDISKENSVPQLHLGYEKKVTKERRPVKRVNTAAMDSSERKRARHYRSEPLVELVNECHEDLEEPQNRSQASQCGPEMRDFGTQWENPSLSDHNYCASNLQQPKELQAMKCKSVQVDSAAICYSALSHQDCLFYTGLNYAVFTQLLLFFTEYAKPFKFQMEIGNQLLMVLIRLRLGLVYADLARRYNISAGLVANIVTTWLPMMAVKLERFIFWLSRETIKGTMPDGFKELFPKTTCIIDCTEIFINRPTILKARAQTYSSYKSHNTLKFLLTIAPNGFVMHVSKCFGGRASDKYIVTNCGILGYLLPGDEVMADRGFTIEEEVNIKGATLNIPTFTKGLVQLSEEMVTSTRRIASLRIHVERAIRRIKEYRIFGNPSAFAKSNKMADNVVFICAALTNLKNPLIREEK